MYLYLNFSFLKIEDGHFEDSAGHLEDNATQALHNGACYMRALHLRHKQCEFFKYGEWYM